MKSFAMKILAIAYRKGGVGKSTLAIHLAYTLAAQGKRVLLIDTDEDDLSEAFPDQADYSNCLVASNLFKGSLACAPRQVAENIWLVPADLEVVDVDDATQGELPDLRSTILENFSDSFDIAVIDTPPNLQRRLISVLAAADAVVSPVTISSFSIHRLPKFLNTVELIRSRYNPDLRNLGLVPFLVNSRSRNELEGIAFLLEEYGEEMVINQPIMQRACVPTSLALAKPIFQAPRSGSQRQASAEMRSACNEIIARLYA
ncbi:ParA family protein [Castellaniella sp.]|uniref:ParA family protein n=1 Tax=Castellaniella sp. TaxID=1955812 RepID=UPI002AFEC5FE|nr:ParA family protein [Castellaniella sp.]